MHLLERVHSWQGLKSALSVESNKIKGDAFEALTHSYLKLDPKYATHLEEVWLLCDVPVEVRDHLNLPSTDEGIDLIARTREGAYWAIQCKYVEDEDNAVHSVPSLILP